MMLKEKYSSAKRYCDEQSGRVGYLVLWLMGAPVSLLLLLWVLFGDNLIGKG
jgi:hypothetical protein